MKSLIIKGSTDFPSVTLDVSAKEFVIQGSSFPEDAKEFYLPIINWIDNYFESPNPQTTLVFEMVYFNTASSKIILDILMKIKEEINKGTYVSVVWKYYEDDEDIMEAGEDYESIVGFPIKLDCIRRTSEDK